MVLRLMRLIRLKTLFVPRTAVFSRPCCAQVSWVAAYIAVPALFLRGPFTVRVVSAARIRCAAWRLMLPGGITG